MDRNELEHVFHNTSKLFESPNHKDKLKTSPTDYIETVVDNGSAIMDDVIVDDGNDDSNGDENNDENDTDRDDVEKVPPLEIDLFMSDVYKYFQARGFKNILVSQIINLFFLTFLVSFVIFLLVCVDINGLLSINDPQSVSNNTKLFYNISDYIHWSNLGSMHWYMAITTTIFVLFLFWRSVKVVSDVHKMYRMKKFFENELDISDFGLSTIRWQNVIDKK
jgi:hypothetical protein